MSINSIGNSTGSLRFLGATDWDDFVEAMSVVERTLRGDPVAWLPRQVAGDDVEAVARRPAGPSRRDRARGRVARCLEIGPENCFLEDGMKKRAIVLRLAIAAIFVIPAAVLFLPAVPLVVIAVLLVLNTRIKRGGPVGPLQVDG